MKKKITVFFLLIICVCVVSCGKKEEAPEFADALFVKLSYTPVDINSDELTYTINIEIYQDSTMRIYADDFIKWYGDEEPETINISISNEDLENVKKSIIENDLYSMQRDVGNKDNMAGVKKSLIIYTKDGEYSVYGINPSNKRFNYVFDMITDLNREELVDYIDSIDLIQKNGAKNDVGIYITDEDDNIIFKKEDIDDIFIEDFYEDDYKVDESDGLKESDDYEIEESNDFAFEESDDYGLEDSDDEVVSHIKIAFKINDSVSDTLNDMTFYLEEDEYVFLKLYNDNVFKMALVAYKEKDKNLIYSGVNYDGYDDEEIMDIIKELKEGLE